MTSWRGFALARHVVIAVIIGGMTSIRVSTLASALRTTNTFMTMMTQAIANTLEGSRSEGERYEKNA
jgi:hypothetical protein